MAALRSLKDERRRGAGAYTITGRGVNTSSVSLGAALSKAQTIASRIQRENGRQQEEVQSIYVRRLGEDAVGRVDIYPDKLEVFKL